MQYSQNALDLAERFRAAGDALIALDVRTTPRAVLDAALRAHDDAATAVAHAVLSDLNRAALAER